MNRINDSNKETHNEIEQISRINLLIKNKLSQKNIDSNRNAKEILDSLKFLINSTIENNNTINDKIKNNFSQINDRLISIEQNFSYLNKDNINKKVLIVGYYGAPNMGDEVMLKAILDQIEKQKKNYEVSVMFPDNSEYNFLQWNNIKFINFPKSQIDIIKITEYFDAMIVGGGAHIDDQYFRDISAYKWHVPEVIVFLSKSFINKRKKTYFLSLSTNDHLINKEYIKNINFIIENSTYFSVRDELSMLELIKNGANKQKIKLLNDPVFLIKDLAK